MDHSSYSVLDRYIHRIAFGSSIFQEVLADIEATLYAKAWENFEASKPVFITSLPRAGTTILLESLSRLPEVSTHQYSDMPFVMTPVLWEKLSGRFRQSREKVERAHGDGIKINENSPEAFEEVFWLRYFPEHYQSGKIRLWNDSVKLSIKNKLQEHMGKIIFLRNPDLEKTGRYVSKNNGNVARVSCLLKMFPNATILVPVRDPVGHAYSLYKQHNNFIELHKVNSFSKKYMGDIGHFEFGELHRPVAFPKLNEYLSGFSPDNINYWLAYWVAAYQYLDSIDGVTFISHRRLCNSGAQGFKKLANVLELKADAGDIDSAAGLFNHVSESESKLCSFDASLLEQAKLIFNRLDGKCLLK
jgi:hypothetical protein